MKRPSKKDIKAAIEELKKPASANSGDATSEANSSAPIERKAPNRIRKKGV